MDTAPAKFTASVTIARNFLHILTDETVFDRAAVHISVDPITGRREANIYTDDGRGNGDCILTVDLSDEAEKAQLAAYDAFNAERERQHEEQLDAEESERA